MDYVFDPAPQASVAVAGSDRRLPVRRIFCVGQNYLAHVLEMGGDPKQPPFFFTKPADAVVADAAQIRHASETGNLHHEVELVVAIGTGGANIQAQNALEHVWGYGVGIDLTRRDLQNAAKNAGKPWDMAKGFDQSAPCGALHPVAGVGHPGRGRIGLWVNGEKRQDSDLSDMIWSVSAVIAALSRLQGLAPGDLIYTGTPSGVGPVQSGDIIRAEIEGLSSLEVSIA